MGYSTSACCLCCTQLQVPQAVVMAAFSVVCHPSLLYVCGSCLTMLDRPPWVALLLHVAQCMQKPGSRQPPGRQTGTTASHTHAPTWQCMAVHTGAWPRWFNLAVATPPPPGSMWLCPCLFYPHRGVLLWVDAALPTKCRLAWVLSTRALGCQPG